MSYAADITSDLNYSFSCSSWRAVQESIIVGVPLGEAQPLWEVWETLLVALKNHGVIVQAASFMTNKKESKGLRNMQ